MNPIYLAVMLGLLIWVIVFMYYNMGQSSFESSSNKPFHNPNVILSVPTFS